MKKFISNAFVLYTSCCLLLFALPTSFVSANNTEPIESTSYIHLDKSFYVTGEVVWYKIYLGPSLKDKSVTIKATIANQKGKVVATEFLQTEGKTYAHGYYKIPFSADSGMYLLQFTAIDKVAGETLKLSETFIPVFNDLQGVPTLVKQDSSIMEVKEKAPAIPANLKVAISLPKTNFKQREAVAATVKVTDAAGNPIFGTVSVSVIDKELVGSGKVESTSFSSVEVFQEGMYIQGKVMEETGTIINKGILGAFSAKDDQIFYSKILEDGRFVMKFPAFNGDKRIQFLGNPKTNEYVKVKLQEEIPVDANVTLPSSNKITTYLNLSRQRKKIFQHYAALESNIKTETIKENKKKVKGNQQWIIKEYKNFEYMYIFFKENLSPLRFSFNADSTYTVRMYNPANQTSDKFFSGKPLFIIDNVATRDGDFVARMRMEDVSKVELFYRLKDLNQNFKVFGSSGVAKITSYQPLNELPVKETKNNFTVQGVQKKAIYPVFHPDQIANNRRQPFFRPQLYWNPELNTDKSGSTSFTYHQTDDRSTFQIQVVVQGVDGQIGYATKEYVVE